MPQHPAIGCAFNNDEAAGIPRSIVFQPARGKNAVMDEIAGKTGPERAKLEEAYRISIAKPHGFGWIRTHATDPNERYWSSFTKRIVG